MQFSIEEIVPDLKIQSSKFPKPTMFPANAYSTPSGYCALKMYKFFITIFVILGTSVI